ncbi:hypothetical protein SLEP1_g30074 [Rubroshorea leprosula]|uniref:Chromo domain-containing protein n=1 Tax=Rubroshorea leprosula TaxID=152421 RepID=A0AAV5K7J7_9ROSI|nr:hypothetical protein SLEP1_g30074 [Rubroshorea leprosula]
MQEELNMFEKNAIWKLVDRPTNKNVIGVKWVYKVKLNSDGSLNKCKARLVVKGYSQLAGIHFTETFAPVAKFDTIRLLFAMATQKSWLIYQLDMKSTFLNGKLKEEIYVEQPDGYVKKGAKHKVYLLKKALYGLRQAPRAWYGKIDNHLLSLGFEKSIEKATLYVKEKGADLIIVSIYVDDLLVTGSCEAMLSATRPDIMYSVSVLSRFMQSPSEMHLKGAKHVLKYVKGTIDFRVMYSRSDEIKLLGFTNSDWARSEDDMKSTLGCCFYIGSGMISWCSRKQDAVAQSTTESEYIAATDAANQAIWMRQVMPDLKHAQKEPTVILWQHHLRYYMARHPLHIPYIPAWGLGILKASVILTVVSSTTKTTQVVPSVLVHNVFHVSLLKKKVSQATIVIPLASLLPDALPVYEPEVVLDRTIKANNNKPQTMWLIKWKGRGIEEASWESIDDIQLRFPSFHP